jgi:hypothetical protein
LEHTVRRKRKNDEPNLFTLRCTECGLQLVPPPSGYLACPQGHGKLIAEAAEESGAPEGAPEPSGLWFSDDEPSPGSRAKDTNEGCDPV